MSRHPGPEDLQPEDLRPHLEVVVKEAPSLLGRASAVVRDPLPLREVDAPGTWRVFNRRGVDEPLCPRQGCRPIVFVR